MLLLSVVQGENSARHDLARGREPGRAVKPPGQEHAILGPQGPAESLTLSLSAAHLDQVDRVGLIVVRVDADEAADPVGSYTLRLR